MRALFLRFKAWIVKAYTTANRKAKVIIPIAVQVVNRIKTFIDSPDADFLTGVIPGTIDDSIKLFLRKVLPGILLGLRKWESIAGIEDTNEKLKAIAEEFKLLSKDERDGLKTQSSAKIIAAYSGLPEPDAKIATLIEYHHPDIMNG